MKTASRLVSSLLLLALCLMGGGPAVAESGRAIFRDPATGKSRSMGGADSAVIGGSARVINDVAGLPAPAAGVITLASGHYFQGGPIDLGANILRVPSGADIVWHGGDYSITSTGSTVIEVKGIATFRSTTVIVAGAGDGITVNDATASLSIDIVGIYNFGSGSYGLNVLDAGYVSGTLSAMFGFTTGARIRNSFGTYLVGCVFQDNTVGFLLDGLIDTTSINIGLIASSSVPSATMIRVAPGATLNAWSMGAGTTLTCGMGQTCMDTAASAFATKGMLLHGAIFIGAGTPLVGVTANSPQALFIGNVGIDNTAPGAFLTITGGASVTTLTLANTYYKLAGTTTNVTSQLFTHANGRYTNASGRTLTCDVIAQADATTSTPSGDYRLAVFLNGTTIQNPPAQARAASSTLSTVTARTRVVIPDGGYVEPFLENIGTAGTTATWTNGSMTITDCN